MKQKWNDLKTKFKAKAVTITKAKMQIGGAIGRVEVTIHELDSIEETIVGMIPPTLISGIGGVDSLEG